MNIGEPRLVSAPIYSFSFSEFPELDNWGWHKVSELVEAINNSLVARGKKPMTAVEIEEEFWYLSPLQYECLGQTEYPRAYAIISDGRLWSTCSNEWLRHLVTRDGYLPAKVGMNIMNAIKHPVRHHLARLATTKR